MTVIRRRNVSLPKAPTTAPVRDAVSQPEVAKPTRPTAPSTPRSDRSAPPGLPASAVSNARASGDPAAIAVALHDLATSRSLFGRGDSTRVERTTQLFAGLNAGQIEAVRAAYIGKYGTD